MLKASIVVSTYNNPAYLEIVLLGYSRQTEKGFELLVCDDGSGEEVKKVIDGFRNSVGFPVKHLWQEHDGFGKVKLLNRAVRESESEYMIFTDGDCLPHSRFCEDHLTVREKSRFLSGRRVELSKKITDSFDRETVLSGRYEKLSPAMFAEAMLGRLTFLEMGIRIESASIRGLFHSKRIKNFGSNFSCWKEDLIRINGFNEDYSGGVGAGEDVDVEFRLLNNSVGQKPLLNFALQYHLYHKTLERSRRNIELFEQTIADRTLVCRNGLEKL